MTAALSEIKRVRRDFTKWVERHRATLTAEAAALAEGIQFDLNMFVLNRAEAIAPVRRHTYEQANELARLLGR
jgi:hypothetical protein